MSFNAACGIRGDVSHSIARRTPTVVNMASGGLLLLLTLYLQGVWCSLHSPVDVSLSLYQLITDVLKPVK